MVVGRHQPRTVFIEERHHPRTVYVEERRPRTLVVDRRKDPELYWMPYDETLVELGEVLADLQTSRLDRIWKLPVLMRRRMRKLRDFFRRRPSPEKG
jgi:hypothetical protein